MSKIELSINVNYLPQWGAWEGIRELVQNGKDAETELGAKLTISHRRGEALRIENEGATLSKEALLFGTTSKAGRSDTIGRFGEGLKLGILALVRKGIDVKLFTANEIWTPKIERSEKYDADVLVFHTRETKKGRNVVRVEIMGFDDSVWETYRAKFLFIDPPSEKEAVKTEKGTLLLGEKYKGDIFVKGIYVATDNSMKYGYDFKYAEVDRDRKMISGWDLRYNSAHVWNDAVSQRPDLLDPFWEMVIANDADVAAMEHGTLFTGGALPGVVLARFKEQFGEDAVPVANLAESADVEHLGKRGVVVSKSLATILSQTVGSKEEMLKNLRNEVVKTYSWHELSADQRMNVKHALEIASAADASVTLDLIDVVDFRSKTMMGQFANGRIRLSAQVVSDSIGDTLGTIIHEWCHHKGADGDKGHVHAIETMWTKVVCQLKGWKS